MAESIEDFIGRAITDPGSIIDEDYAGEPKVRHSTRAVMSLVHVVNGTDPDGFYPGTPASRALMENVQLRADLHRVGEDAQMWARRAGAAEGSVKEASKAIERVAVLENLLALAARQGQLPAWLLEQIGEALPDFAKMEV